MRAVGVVCLCVCVQLLQDQLQQALAHAARLQLEHQAVHQTLHALTGLQAVSLSAVRAATNDFHANCKVGGGGFGAVYQCSLPLGPQGAPVTVAVKRLASDSLQGRDEFMNEVKLLSQLQHRNVVSALGFAREGQECCIITPFFARGSLQAALKGDRKSQLAFSALDRVGACLDVAQGIAFLHAQALPVWHLDLKPDNVVHSPLSPAPLPPAMPVYPNPLACADLP